jgi:PTH1 family peptidyl-tRNA hydrolase
MSLRLIAGLGNPGPEYRDTRHNAGAWFVNALADKCGAALREESRFFGRHARLGGVSLLEPTCWMNRSGRSVAACAGYYKIEVAEILVVHDDLDLEPGTVRLKTGGGHGGHNGLRDIVTHLGSAAFHRLRIGIGHPGNAERVVPWVLSRPSADEAQRILLAIDRALDCSADILAGEFSRAMNTLHQKSD